MKMQEIGIKITVLVFGILIVLTTLFLNVKINLKPEVLGVANAGTAVIKLPSSKRGCFFTDITTSISYEKAIPTKNSNNKFGLYVYAERDDFIEKASELVNSSGGDWGYVLIPFNVKDSDQEKWNRVFTQLNKLHLIPIIQLHDIDLDDFERQTLSSAEFLNNLSWPTKERYISAYNEMNDDNFWYSDANAEEYARILDFTINEYNKINENFVVMNGALNISAPEGNGYIEGTEFLRRMNAAVPGIFSKLEAWASHPYPQPAFRGSPNDTGRNSIRAYEFELNFIKNNFNVALNKVFITETGWPHAEGKEYNPSYLPESLVSQYYKQAFENVWLKDERVIAITPFTIWYDAPNDHFAFLDEDLKPYEQFEVIKQIPKLQGNPEVRVEKQTAINICK